MIYRKKSKTCVNIAVPTGTSILSFTGESAVSRKAAMRLIIRLGIGPRMSATTMKVEKKKPKNPSTLFILL
jgi:hypothetical protein